jgi:hypothetical protein
MAWPVGLRPGMSQNGIRAEKQRYSCLGSKDDFRGEISLMGEIKGPPNFCWAIFLY